MYKFWHIFFLQEKRDAFISLLQLPPLFSSPLSLSNTHTHALTQSHNCKLYIWEMIRECSETNLEILTLEILTSSLYSRRRVCVWFPNQPAEVEAQVWSDGVQLRMIILTFLAWGWSECFQRKVRSRDKQINNASSLETFIGKEKRKRWAEV